MLKLLHRRHTERGLCRRGVQQRWAPRRRGAALGFPFRQISEALSSFSAACPRHINREKRDISEQRQDLGNLISSPCGEKAITPASPPSTGGSPAEPLPGAGAGGGPARPDTAPGACSCRNVWDRAMQLFLIARFCFHHLSLSWLGIFGGWFLFLSFFFFLSLCSFKWMGERRGKGSNYKAGYCDGMLPCIFFGFEETHSRLGDHSLILPSFLCKSWVISNSEKSVFSVNSGGESRALRRHKPVQTKLEEHISETPKVPENPACGEECYNNIKL